MASTARAAAALSRGHQGRYKNKISKKTTAPYAEREHREHQTEHQQTEELPMENLIGNRAYRKKIAEVQMAKQQGVFSERLTQITGKMKNMPTSNSDFNRMAIDRTAREASKEKKPNFEHGDRTISLQSMKIIADFKTNLINVSYQSLLEEMPLPVTDLPCNTILSAPCLMSLFAYINSIVNQQCATGTTNHIFGCKIKGCDLLKIARINLDFLQKWESDLMNLEIDTTKETRRPLSRGRAFCTLAQNLKAYDYATLKFMERCKIQPILFKMTDNQKNIDNRLYKWLKRRLQLPSVPIKIREKSRQQHMPIDVKRSELQNDEFHFIAATSAFIRLPGEDLQELVNIRWKYPQTLNPLKHEHHHQMKKDRRPAIGVRLKSSNGYRICTYNASTLLTKVDCVEKRLAVLILAPNQYHHKAQFKAWKPPETVNIDLLSKCAHDKWPEASKTVQSIVMPLICCSDSRTIDLGHLDLVQGAGSLCQTDKEIEINLKDENTGRIDSFNNLLEPTRGITNNSKSYIKYIHSVTVLKTDWATDLLRKDPMAALRRLTHNKKSKIASLFHAKEKGFDSSRARKFYTLSKAKVQMHTGKALVIVSPYILCLFDKELNLPVIWAHISRPGQPKWVRKATHRATAHQPEIESSSLSSIMNSDKAH